MGGEGPYVEFSLTARSFWASHTGLNPPTDEEIEAAYSRAEPFFRERKRQLVEQHGWIEAPSDSNVLFTITATLVSKWDRSADVCLSLPVSYTSFRDPEQSSKWGRMFRDHLMFDASRRRNGQVEGLHIDSIPPLSDIFYFIQCLDPGILVIIRVDEIDERGETQTSRALPSSERIRDHHECLEIALGSAQKFEDLLAATSRGVEDKWISVYEYDDSSDYYTDLWGGRQQYDYQACDSHCGYCGKCDY